MAKKIPYKMKKDAWVVIVKDGMSRGHAATPTPFYVDKGTNTGMMSYHGALWLFPVEEIK